MYSVGFILPFIIFQLIVMAVTSDEPHTNLNDIYGYLQSLGVPVNDNVLNFQGQFVFMLQLGSPEKTLSNIRLAGRTSMTMDITVYGQWILFLTNYCI